jgi:hypothetical protein
MRLESGESLSERRRLGGQSEPVVQTYAGCQVSTGLRLALDEQNAERGHRFGG